MDLAFSANLGFLWQELPLPEAIRAAHRSGFAAVECHWPGDTPADEVRAALDETGLPILGINTRRGPPGENGLAALPGREAEARAAIDAALAYAERVDAEAVHVMCGNAEGEASRECFLANLRYATSRTERMILIEPLNRHDAPRYFLRTTDQAREVIAAVGAPNLKLIFDCYHVGRTEGDVTTRLAQMLDCVGHIQFASVPDRGAPDRGELHYPTVFAAIKALGWTRPLGAEYRPDGATEASLGWLSGAAMTGA